MPVERLRDIYKSQGIDVPDRILEEGVKALEEKLGKKFAPESCDGVKVPADGLNQDLHGSAEYRASLVSVIAKRAVAAALAG